MYQLISSAEAQTMLASRRQELRNQTKERRFTSHQAADHGKPVTFQEGLAQRIGE